MKRLIYVLLLLVIASTAVAQNEIYHLPLLAVEEANNQYHGITADLFLELKEGSGRVFLDTFPLTKLDTQISTRFAKEVACKHFNLDCNKYDFIFTIKSSSNIIGGPSAGAAMAALTTIAILDLEYQNVAITGTINSGGIIGPVGGVREKLEAASELESSKVLIPIGNSQINSTQLDLISYGQNNLSLEVIEVIDLDEVILQLTGKDLNGKNYTISENTQYNEIMQMLQADLCNRNKAILQEISEKGISLDNSTLEAVNSKQSQAINSTKSGDYYSAASFCFGNNIQLKSSYYREEGASFKTITERFDLLEEKVSELEQQLSNEKIETISDLQALMIVKERLQDVKNQIKEFRESSETNNLNNFHNLLGYAEERFYSALSWQKFFEMFGKKYVLDKEILKNACLSKISEAKERVQYASFFIGNLNIDYIHEKVSTANNAYNNEDYELCLITASQAKADATTILSSLGLNNQTINKFISSKEKAAQRVIFENSAEGVFPILGYSYYQYAKTLKNTQEYSALNYYEYALELSELQLYFPEELTFLEKVKRTLSLDKDSLLFIKGLILGIILTILVLRFKKKR